MVGNIPLARSASLQLTGYEKGAMTDPLMAQLAVNEDEYIRAITENALAIEVFADVVSRDGNLDHDATTEVAWLAELGAWERECGAQKLSPIAVLPNRTDPPWLLDLARSRVGETDEAAKIRKHSEFDPGRGYLGHLGEVAMYAGPVSRGVTVLMTREEFETLQLEGSPDSPFVVDATPDDSGLKCTLKISWRHRLEGRPGPVLRLRHFDGTLPSG